jgi:hypothetical protein
MLISEIPENLSPRWAIHRAYHYLLLPRETQLALSELILREAAQR